MYAIGTDMHSGMATEARGVQASCLPLSTLFSETGSPTDHGAGLVASKPPVFPLPLNPTCSLGFQKPAPYIGTEDLNS